MARQRGMTGNWMVFCDLLFGLAGSLAVLLFTQANQNQRLTDETRVTSRQLAASQDSHAAKAEALAQRDGELATIQQQLEKLRSTQRKQESAAAEEIARLQAELDKRRALGGLDQNDLAERLHAANDKLEALIRGERVDLVIVLDASASMTPALDELKRTIVGITEVICKVSPEFRVGVIPYRESPLQGLPLARVTPTTSLGQSTLKKVISFIQELEIKTASTDQEAALVAAMNMLDRAADGPRKQVLMLISDVGPYEMAGKGKLPSVDGKLEAKLCEHLKRWATAKPNVERRIVAVFQRHPSSNSPLDRPTQEQFKRYGKTTTQSVYAESTADMFKAVLEAALAR